MTAPAPSTPLPVTVQCTQTAVAPEDPSPLGLHCLLLARLPFSVACTLISHYVPANHRARTLPYAFWHHPWTLSVGHRKVHDGHDLSDPQRCTAYVLHLDDTAAPSVVLILAAVAVKGD